MALDLATLANYTKENKGKLITTAVFSGKTISMMTPRPGIKTSEKIGTIETDATFQDGSGCGFNASGTTKISDRTITVGKIKVQESLCPEDLEAKYTQELLKAGSTHTEIPFEQEYSEKKAKKIAAQMETAVWQSDTDSANGNLNKFDGLIKNIGYVYSATGVINVNAIKGIGTVAQASGTAVVTGTGTSFVTQGIAAGDKLRINGAYYTVLTVDSATQITLTANSGVTQTGRAFTFINSLNANFASPFTSFTTASDTAITIIQEVFKAVPIEILNEPDLVFFIGWDVFRTLLNQITNAKYYNYTSDAAAKSGEMIFPGTNIKLVAVNGLNSTNKIFGIRTSNMFFGTDMLNEWEKFYIKYSEETELVKYSAKWKAGANVGFLEEVIQFTLA